MRRLAHASLVVFILACASAGCGDDQDPDGARRVWDKLQADDYQSWERAPYYETAKPSFTAHADKVDIFLNPVLAGALSHGLVAADGGRGSIADGWPQGSVVAKRGYTTKGRLVLVAVMEKRPDGWFFYEYDRDGTPIFSGRPQLCVDCHKGGADFIRSFTFSSVR